MRCRILAVVAVVAFAPRADAHRLEVDLMRDGRTVTLEVFYPGDGRAAAGARVRVEGSGGTVIAEGETDSDGVFVFKTDATGTLMVTADHGGHRSEASLGPPSPDPEERTGGETGPVERGARGVRDSMRRRDPAPALEIIAGLGLVFGAAGFVMAVLAWRRAAALARRFESTDPEGNDAP